MSQENVEVIRRLLPGPDVDIAQVLRNDDVWAVASQAWAAVTHSGFESMIEVPSERSTYAGLDGLREAWLDCKGVDAEVDLLASNVSVFRDGEIPRIGFYAKRAAALEAAGLSE